MFSLCTVLTLVLLPLFGVDSTPAGRTSCGVLPPERVQCGVPKLQPNALPSRPSEAIRGEFPWHAALYQEEAGSFKYSCGGSLIHERFVLTAAHCVVNPSNGYKLVPGRVKIKLGLHELDEEDECVQELNVIKIQIHDQYRSGDYKYDIALIELGGQVVYTQRVLPVCVDTSEKEEHNFFKQYGKVAGWGYTEFDSVSDWLRMTELPFVNYTRCLSSNPGVFANTINEGMFCAGYSNGTSVCNGDSGGGLVTYNRDRWVLQGIVSFTALRTGEAVLCNSEEYAGFTKVRFYRSWLMNIVRGAPTVTPMKTPLAKLESSEEVQQPSCGERKINQRNLIVNGVRSYSGEWPWHVAVFEINGRVKRYICGGTLISEQCVMTAAHCMLDENLKLKSGTIVVQLGQDNLFESSSNMREVRVGKITTNEKYDPVSKTNDIALLELTSTVQFNDYIQPACLPKKVDAGGADLIGSLGSIIGWGYQQPASFMVSNTLQAARVPIVDLSFCVIGKQYGLETDGIICAGSANGTNACTGDSGGGLFFEKDGVWTVRGVVSALDTVDGFCNPDGYLKVGNIASFLRWIKKQIQTEVDKNKNNGNRVMSFLQTGTDYPTQPADTSSSSPLAAAYPEYTEVHHHHHHYYHYNNTGKKQSQCKQDGSNSSESDESGLKALPKKILKSKKCFIKGLLSKLWT